MSDVASINWKPRLYWTLLALLTALIAWRLTHVITHVDRNARSTVAIAFDERPPVSLSLRRSSIAAFQQNRFRIPALVITGSKEALVAVTPAMRSVALKSINPGSLSCRFTDRVFEGASLVFLADAARHEPLQPAPISAANAQGSSIPIPSSLRAALAHSRNGQGVISCTFSGALAAAPTFTDRSLTLHAQNGSAGPVILDVSGLEDIDNVRFSGGVMIPLAGDRTRFLDSTDNVVSVEWVDVSAEEQRDIILVTIGALAAIGAAMAIEAIRPFIER